MSREQEVLKYEENNFNSKFKMYKSYLKTSHYDSRRKPELIIKYVDIEIIEIRDFALLYKHLHIKLFNGKEYYFAIKNANVDDWYKNIEYINKYKNKKENVEIIAQNIKNRNIKSANDINKDKNNQQGEKSSKNILIIIVCFILVGISAYLGFLFESDEQFACDAAKQEIKKQLLVPSSAKFESCGDATINYSETMGTYNVIISVESLNAYNVRVKTQFISYININKNSNGSRTGTYVNMGTKIY